MTDNKNPLLPQSNPLNEKLLKEIHKIAAGQYQSFLEGVKAYRTHPYKRRLPEPPTIWSEGTTRVLDYGAHLGEDAPIILVIPSLINRYYIMDLSEKKSFLRTLAAHNIRPVVIDWGAPEESEKSFSVNDYIVQRILKIIDFTSSLSCTKKVDLLGYCMGGTLATAAAQLRPNKISKLALMATPWDFHAESDTGQTIKPEYMKYLSAPLEMNDQMFGVTPVDWLQTCFYALDPFMVVDKFIAFKELDQGSEKAENFVALEDWINDGVPLTSGVSQDCFVDWYGNNTTQKSLWKVAGERIQPEKIEVPSYVSVPQGDRIVPPDSARALAEKLPNATLVEPTLGHIGMMSSGRAKDIVWTPLITWLQQ
ncbi:MAG: alpha/beta fold hydrolase [Alphaproteobacteria bacterium]